MIYPLFLISAFYERIMLMIIYASFFWRNVWQRSSECWYGRFHLRFGLFWKKSSWTAYSVHSWISKQEMPFKKHFLLLLSKLESPILEAVAWMEKKNSEELRIMEFAVLTCAGKGFHTLCSVMSGHLACTQRLRVWFQCGLLLLYSEAKHLTRIAAGNLPLYKWIGREERELCESLCVRVFTEQRKCKNIFSVLTTSLYKYACLRMLFTRRLLY